MSKLKEEIIQNASWSILGRFASLFIALVTNIWLARILTPEEFGQIGVIMFFLIIANVLAESGLGGALIRMKNITLDDYSTVFITNLIISIVCFLIIVISSGVIANFYSDPELETLLKISSITIIINAFQITHNARLMSNMNFKKYSIYIFISNLIASIGGIFLAYNNYGVWSFIAIQLLTSFINVVLLWIFEGIFLRFYFSIKSFRELYSFGLNTTITSMINTLFENIYQIILTRYFSLNQTGYYFQAKKLIDVPKSLLTVLTQGVLFSSLAKLQDDTKRFKNIYNRISIYFLASLGFIFSATILYSDSIIKLLYGTKWNGSIYFVQLLAISSFFLIQESLTRIIFKVFNKTKQILYLEYLKKTIQLISVVFGVVYLNIEILIGGFILTNFIGYFFNYYFAKKIISSNKSQELIVMLKIIIGSAFLILLFENVMSFFNIFGTLKLITLPAFFLIYLILINYLKIVAVIHEFKNLNIVYNKLLRR